MAEAARFPVDARPRVVAGLRLLSRVGHGGEGEVWEARDADGARRALKLVRPEVLPSPEEMARRGAYLRRIDHPALVRVSRTGRLSGSSLDGWGFVDMEFVDGQPLGSAPADPEALERLAPLAEALDALHRGDWSDGVPLVHRDVKPANLIARPDGQVVLVDCSTLRGTDATHLTRVGTPVFAAPEVMTGRVGPPSDVYSFAATIVGLVTGARGEELAALLAEPEMLDLPQPVARALSADPSQRPRSCRAVLDAGSAIDVDLLPPPPEAQGWGGDDEPWGPTHAGQWTRAEPWTPQAAGGLEEGVEPPAGSPALQAGKGHTGPWLLLLAVVAGLAWVAAGGAAALTRVGALLDVDLAVDGWGPVAAASSAGVHLIACRAAGEPWATTVLTPPAAWAWLLGGRAASPGAARGWTRVTLLGVLTVAVVLAAATVEAGEVLRTTGVLGAGLTATALGTAAGGARGLAAIGVRLLLAPAWLAGALLVLVAATVALPVGLVLGRTRPLARLASGTLAGAQAFVGLRAGQVLRHGPDPRA